MEIFTRIHCDSFSFVLNVNQHGSNTVKYCNYCTNIFCNGIHDGTEEMGLLLFLYKVIISLCCVLLYCMIFFSFFFKGYAIFLILCEKVIGGSHLVESDSLGDGTGMFHWMYHKIHLKIIKNKPWKTWRIKQGGLIKKKKKKKTETKKKWMIVMVVKV